VFGNPLFSCTATAHGDGLAVGRVGGDGYAR
jgi:hypothetical protein